MFYILLFRCTKSFYFRPKQSKNIVSVVKKHRKQNINACTKFCCFLQEKKSSFIKNQE